MSVQDALRYGNDEEDENNNNGLPTQMESESFISSIRMNQSTIRPTQEWTPMDFEQDMSHISHNQEDHQNRTRMSSKWELDSVIENLHKEFDVR